MTQSLQTLDSSPNSAWPSHHPMWSPNRREDLDFLKGLIHTGRVGPVIDRCYQLSEVASALEYVAEGQAARGKVAITMGNS